MARVKIIVDDEVITTFSINGEDVENLPETLVEIGNSLKKLLENKYEEKEDWRNLIQ